MDDVSRVQVLVVCDMLEGKYRDLMDVWLCRQSSLGGAALHKSNDPQMASCSRRGGM